MINHDPEPHVREWTAKRAEGKGMTYAEAFRVITLVSDTDWGKMVSINA